MLDTVLDPLGDEHASVLHAGGPPGSPVPEATPDVVELDEESALAAAVGRALRATGYPALRDLAIEVCGGVVVLGGCVPSYHQKQLAQATVQRLAPERVVANAVEVISGR